MSNALPSSRWIKLAAICAVVAVLALLFSQVVAFKPLLRLEYGFQALVSSLAPPPPPRDDLVFLAIDESTLAADQHWEDEVAASRALRILEAGFPWNREIYALALEKLSEAGARAVVFDLLYDSPREGDEAFAAALEKYRDRGVIGYTFEETVQTNGAAGSPLVNLPSDTLIDWPEADDPRIGFVNFWPNPDKRIWAARYHWTLSEAIGRDRYPDEEVYSSLAASALRQAGMPGVVPEDSDKHYFRLLPMGTKGYKPYPLIGIFSEDIWQANYDGGAFFNDKIVLIGPSSSRFHDIQNTPVGEVHGPALHLNAIQAALDGNFYDVSPRWLDIALVLGCGGLAFLTVLVVRQPVGALLLLHFLAVAYVGGAVASLQFGGLLVTGAAPIATMLVGGFFCLGYEYFLETVEKTRVRGTLERYVSRNVVREILDNPQAYLSELGGSRKEVTILFSDVRGFTTISENSDAGELVAQLNEYLGTMVDIVFRHDGSVDKFIGDAVMAVWGNVGFDPPETSSRRALLAALDMRHELAALNDKWREEGRPPFRIGIGLHHGEVVFGNIGSDKKMEPTVIGDSVNLASRIEGLTKHYQTDILATDSVARHCGNLHLRPLDLVTVKGKSKPVEIFDIPESTGKSLSKPLWWNDYLAGLESYRNGEFPGAIAHWQKCQNQLPDDPTLAMLVRRVEQLTTSPTPPDWSPAVTMTSK